MGGAYGCRKWHPGSSASRGRQPNPTRLGPQRASAWWCRSASGRRRRHRLHRGRRADLGAARRRGRARTRDGNCSPAAITNHGEWSLRRLRTVIAIDGIRRRRRHRAIARTGRSSGSAPGSSRCSTTTRAGDQLRRSRSSTRSIGQRRTGPEAATDVFRRLQSIVDYCAAAPQSCPPGIVRAGRRSPRLAKPCFLHDFDGRLALVDGDADPRPGQRGIPASAGGPIVLTRADRRARHCLPASATDCNWQTCA